MLFKLSIKNIKKSIKDYSIYFFTLVFAVAMFYAFNSIDAQSSMLVLNNSKREIVHNLITLLGYVSVFVSVILGFLICYANNFLIKRRKKEIGLYFTLGMSKRKVSYILTLETIIIGIISLIAGLVLGILLSQGLSIFTAKLFEVNLSGLKFVFSSTAFTKTILYFSIIFILVIIFSILSLSRCKLIDLLNANKKNEQIKSRRKFITIFSFILTIALLGYAYYLLFHKALVYFDYRLAVMLICGSVGTFFLFFSLSGFMLKIIQRIKKVYYRNLNIFILRQVNNKINTTVFSTTIICLLLLLTIGSLSGSLSFAKVFNSDFKENNLSDYSIRFYNEEAYVDGEISNDEKSNYEKMITMINNPELLKYSDVFAFIPRYADKHVTIRKNMDEEGLNKIISEYGDILALDYALPIITETDFNKLLKVQKKEAMDIKDNEYLLLCNVDFIVDSFKGYYKSGKGIEVGGNHFVPGSSEIIYMPIENYTGAGNDGMIVVSDDAVKGLDVLQYSFIGNYPKSNNYEQMEHDFEQFVAMNAGIEFDIRTRTTMENSSIGVKTILIFIGLYLGVTFAISSATVLAINQLSESSDNRNRYKILRQIGADNKMINKALFSQIGIAFMFPLIVALIHAYFGLKEVNKLIIAMGNIDLTSNIIITTIFMLFVYGGYFLLTYIVSKGIIKETV